MNSFYILINTFIRKAINKAITRPNHAHIYSNQRKSSVFVNWTKQVWKCLIFKCYSSEKLITLNILHEFVPTWYSFYSWVDWSNADKVSCSRKEHTDTGVWTVDICIQNRPICSYVCLQTRLKSHRSKKENERSPCVALLCAGLLRRDIVYELERVLRVCDGFFYSMSATYDIYMQTCNAWWDIHIWKKEGR